MLLHTKVKLERLSDKTKYDFFEASLRGGICQASLRHSVANNPYQGEGNWDPLQAIKYLVQYDANNLYALSLRDYLPLREFRWISHHESRKQVCNDEFVASLDPEGAYGYAYEVDVRIPRELHDELCDLPPLPQKIAISSEMLSDFQRECFPESELRTSTRLTCNLYDKERYIMHSRTLKMCLDLGLEIVEYHRVLRFVQAPYMREYVDFNTSKRMEASNENPPNKFKISLYKALNNFLFGKSITNQRKFKDLRLVTSRAQALRLVSSPLFKNLTVVNSSTILVEMTQPVVKLDRAVYIGFSVLELSRLWMFRFWYGHIKKRYPGEKSRLIYMYVFITILIDKNRMSFL
jgi:hypothetical protein